MEAQNKTKFHGEVQIPFVFKSSLFYHCIPSIEDSFYDAIIDGIFGMTMEEVCYDLIDEIRESAEDKIEVLVDL